MEIFRKNTTLLRKEGKIIMKVYNYKRERINHKQLREVLRNTNSFILMNLQDLSTVQNNNKIKLDI